MFIPCSSCCLFDWKSNTQALGSVAEITESEPGQSSKIHKRLTSARNHFRHALGSSSDCNVCLSSAVPKIESNVPVRQDVSQSFEIMF